MHTDFYHRGLLLVAPYFTQFYTTTYQDHFIHRALIGSVCRLIWPGGVSMVVINILALVTAGLLAALLTRSFSRLVPVGQGRPVLFTFAFLASPLAAMLFECLGDPLQVAILPFGLALAAVGRSSAGPSLRWALGSGLLILAFFTHEASAFFLVPALPYLLRRDPPWRSFLWPCLLFAVLILLTLHWSTPYPIPTYRVIPFPHRFTFRPNADIPNMRRLMAIERELYFGSLFHGLQFAVKCLRLLLLGLAGLVAVYTCLPARLFPRFLSIFGTISLFCVPLLIVAIDWGRFLAYIFLLAVLITATYASEPEVQALLPLQHRSAVWGKLWGKKLSTLARREVVQLGALLALMAPCVGDDRITLMPVRDVACMLFLGAFALFVQRARTSTMSETDWPADTP